MTLFFTRSALGFASTARGPAIQFKMTRSLLLVAAMFLGIHSLAFSATVAVGTCTTLATYSTISQAVSSVPPGSTIKICPGIYAEQVVITENLTLIGVSQNGVAGAAAFGANNPTIVSPGNGVMVNANDLYDGSGIAAQIAVVTPNKSILTPIVVNISNLTIDGANNQLQDCSTDLVGIYYQNAWGTVNHVAARNQELSQGLFGCQQGLAIYAESGYGSSGTSAITIENSSVHDYDKNGITADGSGTVATITGNYVVGIGATSLIAQNGIQVSTGASGKVTNNTVTDDVYINPDGGPYYSATGILLYDSGGTSGKPITISGNTVSNAQGGIVTYGDTMGTADYNTITANKVTTSPATGPYLLDGIDLCSNNNTATSNTVFNSSGAGVHIDSQCTEATGASGNFSTVKSNTINEACAGVLSGNGTGNSESSNITYNVRMTSQTGDSCPVAAGTKPGAKLKPLPLRHQ